MRAPTDWPAWLRAPILGFGLGAVAGGFEAIKLAATIRLYLDFGEAFVLALAAVLTGGLLAAGFGLVSGVLVSLVRRFQAPARHAAGMALTAGMLGCWFLWPVARLKLSQGLPLPAAAFALAPIGVVGVIWFNAHYWLRREGVGETHRVGWKGWSLLMALALALTGAAWTSGRSFGSARALDTDPAIVVITVDTLRRDHVSIYAPEGTEAPVQTPVMDALAREGVVFTNAITPMPETAPAHAALFTGRHPVRNGVLSNGHSLASSYQTLAEVLEDEGYATGAFVSSIAVASRTGLNQGFEVYDDDLVPWPRGASQLIAVRVAVALVMRLADPTDFPWLLERPAPVTCERALDWMELNRDRPFFVWVHLFEPHSPYEPHGLEGFEDNGIPGSPSVDHRWILSNEQDFTYTDEVRGQLRRLYAEEVAYTDQQLGVFLERLEALELGRPVTLVLAGDHGEMLGEHGIEFNHHGIFEEAVRVPLIIVPHRLRAYTRVVDPQVRLMDVPATVVDLVKLDPMEHSEGGDLMRFAEGVFDKGWASLLVGRKTASLSSGTLVGYRALRADGEGNVKLIVDGDSGQARLFDLDRDPAEANDISAEQGPAVDALRAQVMAEAGDIAGLSQGAEVDRGTAEGLKALGYME